MVFVHDTYIHTYLLLAEYIPNKQQQQQENPMKSMEIMANLKKKAFNDEA